MSDVDDSFAAEAKVWSKQSGRMSSVLRRCYWGNVLGVSHFRDDDALFRGTIQRLESEAAQVILPLADDRVLVHGPESDLNDESKSNGGGDRRVERILLDAGVELIARIE